MHIVVHPKYASRTALAPYRMLMLLMQEERIARLTQPSRWPLIWLGPVLSLSRTQDSAVVSGFDIRYAFQKCKSTPAVSPTGSQAHAGFLQLGALVQIFVSALQQPSLAALGQLHAHFFRHHHMRRQCQVL